MTITFPRDLPDPPRIRTCKFDVDYQQVRAPTRGGLVQVVNTGVDLWTARYETVPLREAAAESYRAWAHSMRGGARFFRMWNPIRRYAISYPAGYGSLTRAGGGSFADGTATLSAIATLRDTITLTTLPASFAFKAGDLVSIPFGSAGRTLHRVMENATASGAGSATITIEPTIPLAVTTGVTADLLKPWCKGVIDPRTVQSQWSAGRMASVVFEATQVF